MASDEARHRRAVHSRARRERYKAERVEIEGELVHPNPGGGHGSPTAYVTYCCRCPTCRTTNSTRQRESRNSRSLTGRRRVDYRPSRDRIETPVEIDLTNVFTWER